MDSTSEWQDSLPREHRPGSWNSLPIELRHSILENVGSIRPLDLGTCWRDPIPLAAYASVCREWQMHFEPITFAWLELAPYDLELLKDYVSAPAGRHRIAYLRWVHMRVILPRYGCDRCNKLEEPWEMEQNSKLLTDALKRLFGIMATWGDGPPDPRRPLELELSAHSPSDYNHKFKSLRDRSNDLQCVIKEPPKFQFIHRYHDPRHGWRRGRLDYGPSAMAWERVMGHMLDILRDTRLPKLRIVGSFLIRRLTYRSFLEGRFFAYIFDALPNLTTFRYEPWRRHMGLLSDGTTLQMHYYTRLIRMIRRHPNINKVSIFEDFGDLDLYTRRPRYNHEKGLRDVANGKGLAEASQGWSIVHLSFIIDACDFFQDFQPETLSDSADYQWKNLTNLCLTSDVLRGYQGWDLLLDAAARAALKMPKLERLTLWTGGKRYGCIFEYFICATTGTRVLRLSSTWGARLDPQTEQLWTDVASQHDHRHPLDIRHHRMRADIIGSHGSILPMLCEDFVATGSSQARLIGQGYFLSDRNGGWRPRGNTDNRTIQLWQSLVHPKTRDIKRCGWTYEYRYST